MSVPSSQPLAAGEFDLANDAWGRLILIDPQGMRHEGVEPIRAFPLSDPQRWVAICGAEGRYLIADFRRLDAYGRRMLDRFL
jgi:hypothetical protein